VRAVLGILSDSHAQAERTRRAITALQARGATMFLHCGDVETDQVLDTLAGLDAHVVFGNCDRAGPLGRYAQRIGLQVHHPMGRLAIQGRRVAFTHGDDPALMQAAVAEGVDYLFHGHTHERSDRMVDATRVINPGALHRATPFTVALLRLPQGELESIVVP
jgi:putative phosphoesterase